MCLSERDEECPRVYSATSTMMPACLRNYRGFHAKLSCCAKIPSKSGNRGLVNTAWRSAPKLRSTTAALREHRFSCDTSAPRKQLCTWEDYRKLLPIRTPTPSFVLVSHQWITPPAPHNTRPYALVRSSERSPQESKTNSRRYPLPLI